MIRNIKLILEYDGTSYGGWQRQKNTVTIQEKIEEAIKKITKEEVSVIGCSRTDAGVHAKQFVCNFNTSCSIPGNKIREAINSKLPNDIRVLNSEDVDNKFHSRYNSVGKTYSYTICEREVSPALYRNYICHIKYNLNLENMKEASKILIGTHDFASFKSSGSSVKTSIRTISEIHICKEDGFIKIYVTADGFLYNMMRIIVGTLIEIGNGKRKVEDMYKILEACNRTKAGKSAPAQGLCLEKVYY